MNREQIAKTIVLYFHQGNGDKVDKWTKLASELTMPLTKEQIEYGIKNVFFNDQKKWADWQKEGGDGMQLYGLRMFVSNALHQLNQFPLLDKYEDEVDRVKGHVFPLVSHLKKMGIKFGIKQWWQFWK